jgi:iron complex outermembrane receptor protein
MAQQAYAQTQADEPKMHRVEITGSSIKRIDSETALPVQLISREDIEKMGATTAAELVKNISANTAPLTDGPSITDGTSGQRGLNGANMRGLGVSSTLILLNGRRLANFASPGDNAGVDLNNIPAGAIQRVEVLKDGASAIYGTDAIGGVINFITRKDYTGIDLAGSAGGHPARRRRQAHRQPQRRHRRPGHRPLQRVRRARRAAARPPALGPAQLHRSAAGDHAAGPDVEQYLPGQRRHLGAQRAALIGAGLLPAGSTVSRVNPSAPGCNPPATVYAAKGPGGVAGCSYDYMEDTEIYPDSRKIGFIGRATFQLDPDNQLFAELVQTEAKTKYVLSPNPVRIRNLPVSILPRPTATRSRARPAGHLQRHPLPDGGSGQPQQRGDEYRPAPGAGRHRHLAGWDYDVALARAENRAVDKYVDGYVLYDQFDAGVRNGTINPFAPSSQAGLDLINSIKISDEARKAKGVSTSIDGKMSRALARWAAATWRSPSAANCATSTRLFTPSDLLNVEQHRGRPRQHRCRPASCSKSRPRTTPARWPRCSPKWSRRSPRNWRCSSRCATTTTAKSATRPIRRSACAGSRTRRCCCAPRPAPASARPRCRT